MKKIKVVLVEPNKNARVTKIKSKLEDMQHVVGGYIQAIYPYEDPVAIVCNEEGKLDGLPLNRALKMDGNGEIYDIISGTFFIAGLNEENFDNLSDELAEKYLNKFLEPEKFYVIDNKIISVKYHIF